MGVEQFQKKIDKKDGLGPSNSIDFLETTHNS